MLRGVDAGQVDDFDWCSSKVRAPSAWLMVLPGQLPTIWLDPARWLKMTLLPTLAFPARTKASLGLCFLGLWGQGASLVGVFSVSTNMLLAMSWPRASFEPRIEISTGPPRGAVLITLICVPGVRPRSRRRWMILCSPRMELILLVLPLFSS